MVTKIAVASPPYPHSLADACAWVQKLAGDAAAAGAQIVCFPETYLPGYPEEANKLREQCSSAQLEAALQQVCRIARDAAIGIILPMDWYEGSALLNVAQVIDKSGEVVGYQAKNQLDPSEDSWWTAGEGRRVFELDGLRFGIAICHEGFRYPETVRWMARQGAQVVFHPNYTGNYAATGSPVEWGDKNSPYYEKAQMVRALENTIYFAPSNYAFPCAESASAIIDPAGACLAWQSYGEVGVAIAEIDTDKATGLLARRFKPEGLSETSVSATVSSE